MLQASLDTTSHDTETAFARRPRWVPISDDPRDPIFAAINGVRCAYADYDAYKRRQSYAETADAVLPQVWDDLEREHMKELGDAMDVLGLTVPQTKSGVFEAIAFYKREVDPDYVGYDGFRQFLHNIETALLQLNG